MLEITLSLGGLAPYDLSITFVKIARGKLLSNFKISTSELVYTNHIYVYL
jgi:hypothetical protein